MATQKSLTYALLIENGAIDVEEFVTRFLAVFPNKSRKVAVLAWTWKDIRVELGLPKVKLVKGLIDTPLGKPKGFSVRLSDLAAIKAEVAAELSA